MPAFSMQQLAASQALAERGMPAFSTDPPRFLSSLKPSPPPPRNLWATRPFPLRPWRIPSACAQCGVRHFSPSVWSEADACV